MTAEREPQAERAKRLAHLASVVSLYAKQRRPDIQRICPESIGHTLDLLDGLSNAIEGAKLETTHAVSSQVRDTTGLGYEDGARFTTALGACVTKTMPFSELDKERADAIRQEHDLSQDQLAGTILMVGRLGTHIDPIYEVTFYKFVLGASEYVGLILDIRANPATPLAGYASF